MQKYKVVIVGAGIAGLTAGHELRRRGINDVLIVEAQDYVGGRIKTNYDWGAPSELGAEFIHGDKTVTYQIAQDLNLMTVPAFEDKKLVDENGQAVSLGQKKQYYELLEYVEQNGRSGTSVAALINNNPITDDRTVKAIAVASVGDLEAGDADKLDSGAYSFMSKKSFYNGENVVLKDGYQPIIKYMSEGLNIALDTVVRGIDYSGETVILTLSDNELIETEKVLITISLGVLKSGLISFTPQLPDDKLESIQKIGMGNTIKYQVRFRDSHKVQTLFRVADGDNESLQTITNWWSCVTNPKVLVGYCGGKRAEYVMSLPEGRLYNKVVSDLSKIAGRDINEDIVDHRLVRWDDNPYILGAYSNNPVGVSHSIRADLAKPIGNKLFFAGEATMDNGNYATVHGAIESGFRASSEVINSIVN